MRYQHATEERDMVLAQALGDLADRAKVDAIESAGRAVGENDAYMTRTRQNWDGQGIHENIFYLPEHE
jgi:H2-forming N5,N10-methylenetetrahydromethanopterin dehydrogenase-like enzyme